MSKAEKNGYNTYIIRLVREDVDVTPHNSVFCWDYLKEQCRLFAWQNRSKGISEDNGILCQTSLPFATYCGECRCNLKISFRKECSLKLSNYLYTSKFMTCNLVTHGAILA